MDNENWEKLVIKIVEENELEFVEIKKEYRKNLVIIKLFIDKDCGVTISDCTKLSRLINDRFFVEDVFPGEYRLEVSSPGLKSRVLKSEKDFKKQINRKLRIQYRGKTKEENAEGVLESVSAKELVLKTNKSTVTLELDKILFGKILLPW